MSAEATACTITLNGEEGSRRFACRLAAALRGGMTVGFSGSLGAGKTTLIRLLVAELGGLTPVSSPTYVLQHEYPTSHGLIIDHWDLYRLSALPEELQAACQMDRIRLIEWPERACELIPFLDLYLDITFPVPPVADDQRLVTIVKGILPEL